MKKMNVWGWVLVGIASLMMLSVLVGFALARILGRIAHDLSELVDDDMWASAPLTRAGDSSADAEAPQRPAAPTRAPHRTS